MTEFDRVKQSNKLLARSLTALIVILSFWFIYRQINDSEIDLVETLSGAQPIIIFAPIFVVIVMSISPIIWQYLMLGSGAKIPLRDCFGIWWSTNIAKYVPGKVTLVVGRAYVGRKYGAKVVVESFIWELLISISSALIAGLMLIILEDFPPEVKLLFLGGVITSLLPLISPTITQKIVRKPFSMLGRGNWEVETSMTRRVYSIALILMTVSWLAWGLAHKFILLGLGFDASLPLLIGSFSLAWLAGFSAFFLPAGIGAREGVFTFNLSLFLSGGIAGVLAVTSRLLNVVIEVLLFFVGASIIKSSSDEQE